jgi:hypothetical protein
MPSQARTASAAATRVALVALLAIVLVGCSGGGHHQANTRTPTSPTTPAKITTSPPARAVYNWERSVSPALSVGSGPSGTLAAVLAPPPGGRWTVAGTRSAADGTTTATVWTSPNARTWKATALTSPQVDSAAGAAATWGSETVVVGSVGRDAGRHAAMWISAAPGAPFVPVEDDALTTPGSAMDAVAVGDLGLFAAGSSGDQVALWYSSTGRTWTRLARAEEALAGSGQAHVDTLLVTGSAVYAGGWYRSGSAIDAGLWSSQDGINWRQIRPSEAVFTGPGNQLITGLAPLGTGLLAVGGTETGAGWRPASWISPNGVSWSPPSTGFATPGNPARPEGEAVVRAVSTPNPEALSTPGYPANPAAASFVAVGGGPTTQYMWRSTDGVHWSEVNLPGASSASSASSGSSDWNASLVAESGRTTVVADGVPGEPHVVVQRGASWAQPSASPAVFGPVARRARAAGLVAIPGSRLILGVDTAQPGQALGGSRAAVDFFSSSNGSTWAPLDTGGVFAGSDLEGLVGVSPSTPAVGASSGPATTAEEARQAETVPAGLVAVGSRRTPTEVRASAWVSSDGTSWARSAGLDPASTVVDDVADGVCASSHAVVAVGGVLAGSPPAGGQTQVAPRAWFSRDGGKSWTVASFTQGSGTPESGPQLYLSESLAGCVTTASGFEAFGAATLANGTTVPAFWSSLGGNTWTRLATSPFGAGFPFPAEGVVSGSAGWFAVGGGDPIPAWVLATQAQDPSGLWLSSNASDESSGWLPVNNASTAFGGEEGASIDQVALWGLEPVVAGDLNGQVAVWTGLATPATPSSSASAVPTSKARHIPA